MERYWRLYRTFFVNSFFREIEFKANFIAKVIGNVMWIGFFLMILFVIYANTKTVAGWGRGDAMILAATVFLMNAVATALFPSLQEIPLQVRMGTLDFVVTKPIDTQFWVSTRRFNFDQVGPLLAGFVMVIIGIASSGHHPSALSWIDYTILLVVSLAIFYSFSLFLMTSGIWLVRVDNLWVLGESATQVARYPLDIYGVGIQKALTYVLPIAFLATIPARQIVLGPDPWMLALGLAWAVVAVAVSRWFWRFALRHYSSASS